MSKNKMSIVFLFLSVFLAKVLICFATLVYQSSDQRLFNSLIMQLEIEHGPHPTEEAKELINKESSFVKYENHHVYSYLLSHLSEFVHPEINDLYPINRQYREIITPPPEYNS